MRVLLVVCVLASPALAQPASPPSPATVLANVQAYYANVTDYSAKVRVTSTQAGTTLSTHRDGIVVVANPGQYRLDFYERERNHVVLGESFVFDGTTQWDVDYNARHVIQTSSPTPLIDAALMFVTGGVVAWPFNIGTVTAASGTSSDIVLELVGTSPVSTIQSVSYVIAPTNWRVKQVIVVGLYGSTTQFAFFEPTLTKPTKRVVFTLVPPKNYTLTVIP